VGGVQSADFGGTGATRSPRFGGEHGEDPRFVTARARRATMRAGRRGASLSHGPYRRRRLEPRAIASRSRSTCRQYSHRAWVSPLR